MDLHWGVIHFSIIWEPTWEDVSTGWGKSSGFGGKGVTKTMGSSLLGWNSPVHAQRCQILPRIGAASLLWSY